MASIVVDDENPWFMRDWRAEQCERRINDVTRLQLLAAVLLVVAAPANATSQGVARHLTTVESLHQYARYFHLQNVLLHGEFVESGARVVLRGGERDVAVLLNGTSTASGMVEVRGHLLDVGRLEPGDPRLTVYHEARDSERWPQPGEELLLVVTAVTDAPFATTPSVRGLALQPWRFEGQTVTIVGQFRGRKSACGGNDNRSCDDIRRYQLAAEGKKIETPDDLDDLDPLREMPLPEASPQPERPEGSPCIDLPPSILSG